MNPQEKWFAILYIAWAGLLLVSAFFQSETAARRSHLMGVAGFALLFLNLFVASNPYHFIVRLLALAVLTVAAVTFFRSRSRLPG